MVLEQSLSLWTVVEDVSEQGKRRKNGRSAWSISCRFTQELQDPFGEARRKNVKGLLVLVSFVIGNSHGRRNVIGFENDLLCMKDVGTSTIGLRKTTYGVWYRGHCYSNRCCFDRD